MKKERSYSDILDELEDTIEKMNNGEVPIDKLEKTVKSASKKIRLLRTRLRSTEAEIAKALQGLDDKDDNKIDP